ncbi:MAG: ribosome assembly RNA-binding protein YhbY [Phycisphaerae bacterium]|jgi:RNA-binding protein|nr:ribosome assembly RNA-binding protein YhbY [Phycisphaerae bacterium]
MVELTAKQKKHLRGLGQRLDPLLTVGKEGITDPVVSNVSDLLDKRELIKVRLSGPSGEARKEVGPALAEAANAECISIVGRTVVLYRPNPDLKPSRRVHVAR